MRDLKTIRDYLKSTGYKFTVKTNGDFCNITNKKLYALFINGERYSQNFTVAEITEGQLKEIVKRLSRSLNK